MGGAASIGTAARLAVSCLLLLSACSSADGNRPGATDQPPSDLIAYACDRSICTITPSGNDLVQITDATGSVDSMPDWSPDRTTIVFARQVDAQADIYVVSADGMDERRLTNSPSSEVQPRWSPDGAKILFASDEMGSNDIWVMDSDGSHALRLTDEAANAFDAVWSPDGDRIAYTVATPTSAQTWTMGTDGSDRELLIEGRGTPSYSPDGSLIVLGGLDIVDVATGEVVRSLAVGAEGDIHAEPTWSADGHWIAYRSGPFDEEAEIYVVSADGADKRQVTDNQTLDSFPDWS